MLVWGTECGCLLQWCLLQNILTEQLSDLQAVDICSVAWAHMELSMLLKHIQQGPKMYTQLRFSLVFGAKFPNIFVNCGNHCYSSQLAGTSQYFSPKFRTERKFLFFLICLDLLSRKMCQPGVHQCVSNSAAWAHVELTMLLKNIRLLLVGMYLAFDKIFLACLSVVCVSVWKHGPIWSSPCS